MERWQPELSSNEQYLFGPGAAVHGQGSRWPRLLDNFLIGETSVRWLALATAVPALVGAWLVLSPGQVLSREMTWDLLFNLAGAWHLESGQVAHVDYHDPLGFLFYGLTQLGFRIVGPIPFAFLIGQTVFAAFTLAAALVAVSRRLTPFPAFLFVLYVVLQVLLPANVGDLVNAYSFAMSYNRWGWSLLMPLCLILVLPRRSGEARATSDAVTCGVLLIALFYLKITFFVAGVMAVGLAFLASDHVRKAWRTWAIAIVAVFVATAAPYNYPYWSDILHGITAGYARASLWIQFTRSLDNKAEYSLYAAGILLMVWLWQSGRVPFHRVVLALGTLAIGMFVLSQNAQEGQIGLGVVIACLLYASLCDDARGRPFAAAGTGLALVAVMVWPLISVTAMASTMAGYHRAAQRESTIVKVSTTNLRTLAVPTESQEVADALAKIDLPYKPLSITLEPPLNHQITQLRYVQTMLEAASLFASGQRGQPKIWVADQVNPVPFILGFPPPRRERLWTRYALRPLPPTEVLGDVDVILIPKYPTYAQVTAFALTTYYDYIAANFPVQEQTASWTILSRQPASPRSDGATARDQQ